ncbi:MAG: hypothetical protein K0B02_04020 [DPANN group archaeon]|nr:hypothetical protein [DPANN group archaeon]
MSTSPNLETRILKKLESKPYSVSHLAEELGLRRDFLSGYLEALKMSGKLELIVVGKAKVYQPKREVSV